MRKHRRETMSNEPITISDVIYDFILRYAGKLYDENNVFLGFQNDYVLPKNGAFIIFQLISHADLTSPSEQQLSANSRLYQTVREATLQVDFYGANAVQASSMFASMLRSTDAANFLLQYGLGLCRPEQVQNLTDTLDDKQYINRFMVQFNIRYYAKMEISNETFITAKINSLNLVEGDKICHYQSIE